jgi:hypothetical protein
MTEYEKLILKELSRHDDYCRCGVRCKAGPLPTARDRFFRYTMRAVAVGLVLLLIHAFFTYN